MASMEGEGEENVPILLGQIFNVFQNAAFVNADVIIVVHIR